MNRIIVLDVDGTLVCTRIDWDALRDKIKKTYGLKDPLKPLGESLYRLLGRDEEKLSEAFRIVEEAELESTSTLEYDPRLPLLIRSLWKKGYRIIIVSMRSKKTLEPILVKIGIKDLVSDTVTREEYHTRLEQLRAIIEKYGKRNILFIGDTGIDEKASRILQIPFIKACCRSSDENSVTRILEKQLEGEK